jgi:hypothetical protein
MYVVKIRPEKGFSASLIISMSFGSFGIEFYSMQTCPFTFEVVSLFKKVLAPLTFMSSFFPLFK